MGGGTVTEAEVQKNVSDSRYKHEAVHTHVRLVFKLLSNDNSVVPTDSHCFGLSVLCCAALILQTGESGGGGGGRRGDAFRGKTKLGSHGGAVAKLVTKKLDRNTSIYQYK